MLFRRRRDETYNEILLREAAVASSANADLEDPLPADPPRSLEPVPGSFLGRARPYDAIVTVHIPDLAGDSVEFATLPDGDIVVDEEQGDADLSPMANALEKHLGPPYRAFGRREEGDLWAVAAMEIDVRRLSFEGGDRLELVCREGRSELRVDRLPSGQEIPELRRAGEERGREYSVEAERLDGDLWEVRAAAL